MERRSRRIVFPLSTYTVNRARYSPQISGWRGTAGISRKSYRRTPFSSLSLCANLFSVNHWVRCRATSTGITLLPSTRKRNAAGQLPFYLSLSFSTTISALSPRYNDPFSRDARASTNRRQMRRTVNFCCCAVYTGDARASAPMMSPGPSLPSRENEALHIRWVRPEKLSRWLLLSKGKRSQFFI